MPNSTYFPTTKPEQADWYTNMAKEFPSVQGVLGFSSAEATAWVADCRYAAYLLVQLPADSTGLICSVTQTAPGAVSLAFGKQGGRIDGVNVYFERGTDARIAGHLLERAAGADERIDGLVPKIFVVVGMGLWPVCFPFTDCASPLHRTGAISPTPSLWSGRQPPT